MSRQNNLDCVKRPRKEPAKQPSYSKIYRDEHGIAQLNFSIPKELKTELIRVLKLKKKTTIEMVMEWLSLINKMDHK